MSYNIEQPITGELASAKANKGGDDITNPATWRENLDVPNTLDSRRRAFAGGQPGVAFDGIINSRVLVNNVSQPISTGDFSIWVRARVPSASSSNQDTLATLAYVSSGQGSGEYGCTLRFFTQSNTLDFLMRDGAGVAASGANAQITFPFSTHAGTVVDFVVTRTGNNIAIYINGAAQSISYTNQSVFANPVGNYPTQPTQYFCIGNATVTSYRDRIYRAVLFNRALSAQDVADLIVNGVADADQWGTQTQIVGASANNGGFETNSLNASGTWHNLGALGSSVGSIDTSGLFSNSGSNAGKLTLDSSASFCGFTAANGSNIATVGKRYRFAFFARKGASSGACGVQYGHSVASNAYGVTGTTLTTTHQRTVAEFVAAYGTITLGRQSGSAANAEIYIDDVSLERIGALVDLNLGEGAGLCFTDRSTNGLHGVGNGGVSHIVPGREGCVRIRTTASGNTQLGGAGIIPANARIRFITADAVSGTPTVTMGNASGGAQHVASVALAAGLNELTVASRFNATGNLWVNVSTASTVDWTVRFDIVD